MRKIGVFLIAIITLFVSECYSQNAKSYNSIEELAKGVVQIMIDFPSMSEEQWINMFLPSFKIAKSENKLAISGMDSYEKMTEEEAIEFYKKRYKEFKEEIRELNIDCSKFKYEGYVIRDRVNVYFSYNGEEIIRDCGSFEYNGKYYLIGI